MMSEPVTQGWVDVKTAAELSGYSVPYVRQLAQHERVEARKVGRDWLIERASLLAYVAAMDRLGAQKHSPWRADLPGGRGREA